MIVRSIIYNRVFFIIATVVFFWRFSNFNEFFFCAFSGLTFGGLFLVKTGFYREFWSRYFLDMDVLSEAIRVLGTKKLWATRKMVFFLGEVAILSSCQHFFSGQKIGHFSSSRGYLLFKKCCNI